MTAWHEDGLTVTFLARVGEVQENGCWLWTGALARGGYGKLTYKGRDVSAHRAAYELAKGPIPAGLVIDHLCRVHACVNPDHLEAVTQRENLMRGLTIPATNAAKTHCKNGHEFTQENTSVDSRGWRQCVTCRRAADRRRRSRSVPAVFSHGTAAGSGDIPVTAPGGAPHRLSDPERSHSLAESSPSPADMSGTRRLGHPI